MHARTCSPSANTCRSSLWSAVHGSPHTRHNVGPFPQDVRIAAPSTETCTLHCTRDTVFVGLAMFQRLSTIISSLRSAYGK